LGKDKRKNGLDWGPIFWDLVEDRPISILQQLERNEWLRFPGEKEKKNSSKIKN
jgi:hypothetical protein